VTDAKLHRQPQHLPPPSLACCLFVQHTVLMHSSKAKRRPRAASELGSGAQQLQIVTA
jgi:hypothetical protein